MVGVSHIFSRETLRKVCSCSTLVHLFIFGSSVGRSPSSFSYIEPAPGRAKMDSSSRAPCQSQECRVTPSAAYYQLGDWTSKQELHRFMNKAVIGAEQGLRATRGEALAWVFSGQGSFLGRSLMKGGGVWVRVRAFQATRMAHKKDRHQIQGLAL